LDADELAFLSSVEAEERQKEQQTRAETQKALDEFKVCHRVFGSILLNF